MNQEMIFIRALTPCRSRDYSFGSAEKGDSENRGCRELVPGMIDKNPLKKAKLFN